MLGTLKGFGVTEIFQLISQQMKTGSLVLTSPKATVTIDFENGLIVGLSNDAWDRDPRSDVLLKAGCIQDKDLRAAMESSRKNGQTWDEILISRGQLKKALLDRASNVVIRQSLLDVFQWREGSYKFEDWNTDHSSMLTCHIPTEAAILDTLRVIDEWPTIKQKIPPVDYCPVTIIPLTEEIVRHHELTEVDLHIYDLIDDKRTVERIVRESLEPPFEALASLVKLMDLGLVEVFPEGAADVRDISITRGRTLARIRKVVLYAVLLLCVAALLLTGQSRILFKDQVPQVILDHLARQSQLAERFSGAAQGPSGTGTGSGAR
ncbi:MAG TPA: DUF4388 domain-containing protein [Deltaproteobacteria bacterium]|nr:DUF4388 domain-containing protein [Deltaproteobacteria bacterium]